MVADYFRSFDRSDTSQDGQDFEFSDYGKFTRFHHKHCVRENRTYENTTAKSLFTDPKII
jgi:hypothetical protein